MGGLGSGGARIGAGRPRKSATARVLDGNAGHRTVVRHPSSTLPAPRPPVPVEAFDAPDELSVDERNVWLRLAPHAFANGTLTKATEYAFCLLCRNIVLERLYAGSVQDKGGASHRGVIQIIDRELLRFDLAPLGKPKEQPEAPPVVDPLKDKYFAGRRA